MYNKKIKGNAISRNGLKVGDVVYAYAYRLDSTKENNRLKQEPIKGAIAGANVSTGHAFSGGYQKPRYFVPYKKSADLSNDPMAEEHFAWSKAVKLESRVYADHIEAAWADYLMTIKNEKSRIQCIVNDINDDLEYGKTHMCKTLDDDKKKAIRACIERP